MLCWSSGPSGPAGFVRIDNAPAFPQVGEWRPGAFCRFVQNCAACGLRIADTSASTNGWSVPTMQLHSGGWWPLVKADILPKLALSDLRKCRAVVRSCERREGGGACGLRIADNSAAINDWSSPTMQLHSGGWWSLVKADIFLKSGLGYLQKSRTVVRSCERREGSVLADPALRTTPPPPMIGPHPLCSCIAVGGGPS